MFLIVEIFLKVNTILKELNDIDTNPKQEENDVSLLTESSLDVSRAFDADLEEDNMDEKNFYKLIFTPLSKYI